MKITVIGTINKDIIIPHEDVPAQSLGGLFYAITTLMNFLGPNDQIIPISYYGKNIAHLIDEFRDKWESINFDGLVPYDGKNHEVILEYYNSTDRKERALFFFPKLQHTHIAPFLDSDLILVNMITGREMDVNTFKKFARDLSGKIYIDIHSLMLEVDGLGNRFSNRPDDIFEWINYARFVQMNEREYETINREGIEFNRFWKSLLKPSQNVFITLGEKGVWWVSNSDGIMIKKYPAYSMKHVKETTGCGDVFGASFCYRYLQTGNINEAIEFGILAGSASTAITGTENFYRLKEEMALLNEKLVGVAV